MQEVEITETTVEYLGDVRVGAGSIYEQEYELPDGTRRSGIAGWLIPEDNEQGIVVGEGSHVTIGGKRWEVISVVESGDEPFDYGSFTLRELPD